MTTVRRIVASPTLLLTVVCSVTVGGWTWVLASPPQQFSDERQVPATESFPVVEFEGDKPATSDDGLDQETETPPSANSGGYQPEASPRSGLRPLELPDIDLSQLPQISAEVDTDAARVIQNAIDGKPLGGPVNDGLLSDVIQVIRKSSRINTSSLDPDLLREDGTLLEPESNTESNAKRATRVRAAEQLLKASRLLERAGKDQPERMDLVNRMRAEAVSLLSE